MSAIGWVDFSSEHREKVKSVIDLLSTPDFAGDLAQENADEMFNYGCGQPGLEHLTTTIIQSDITAIETAAEKAKELADNWIAHTSKTPTVTDFTYGELHDSIDTMTEVYKRYYALVTGNMPLLIPLEDYDCLDFWQRVWPPRNVSAEENE